MSASVARYRELIPAHAGVLDATVEVWLEEAVAAHTASAWGNRYVTAMCFWAAHQIERLPKSGANGSTAEEAGAISAQSASRSEAGGKSSTLSRSYATPTTGTAEEQDLRTTKYGQHYLSIRKSRAARAPFVVGAATSTDSSSGSCA